MTRAIVTSAALVLALTGGVSTTSSAQTLLFNSNATDAQIGNAWEMSGFRDVAYFSLGSDATLTQARVGITYQPGAGTPNPDPAHGFRGQFDWTIFTSSNGSPGSVVASGSVIPTFTYSYFQPDFTKGYATFDLPSVFVNGSTDYWFSALNTDASHSLAVSYLYWSAGYHADLPASQTYINGTWSPLYPTDDITGAYGNRLAVDLFGTTTTTPEPTSLALVGSGLLGTIPFIRRRRSRRATTAG